MRKSPLSIVQQKFGDKAKLVAALEPFTQDSAWVKRLNEKKGLSRVSNTKLLKLLSVFTEVKDRFGSRDKLVDEIVTAQKRTKDEGYRKRLDGYTLARLYDLYCSATGAKVKSSRVRLASLAGGAFEAGSPGKAAARSKRTKAAAATGTASRPIAKRAGAGKGSRARSGAASKRKKGASQKGGASSNRKGAKG
jgi:hypothetical protein